MPAERRGSVLLKRRGDNHIPIITQRGAKIKRKKEVEKFKWGRVFAFRCVLLVAGRQILLQTGGRPEMAGISVALLEDLRRFRRLGCGGAKEMARFGIAAR